eukprot:3574656-Amphidinium_carterae.1
MQGRREGRMISACFGQRNLTKTTFAVTFASTRRSRLWIHVCNLPHGMNHPGNEACCTSSCSQFRKLAITGNDVCLQLMTAHGYASHASVQGSSLSLNQQAACEKTSTCLQSRATAPSIRRIWSEWRRAQLSLQSYSSLVNNRVELCNKQFSIDGLRLNIGFNIPTNLQVSHSTNQPNIVD